MDGDAGLVVEARNSKVLAEAIELLIKDPERMRMMGSRAREVDSRFSVEKRLDRLEGVYDQLLETR
jgi:glycosyltransferase involved in cell wall biosynthesis